MPSDAGYASFLATATDLSGRAWAAWAENGLIYAACWDPEENRWSEAAPISNANGGRNVRLTAGQVVNDSATGQAKPALVVTWEAGVDNDADILAAVGFHRSDGTIYWSDAVNLLPGGVAENKHTIGISGTNVLLATEAQPVQDSIGSGGPSGSGGSYLDREINTYELEIRSRASALLEAGQVQTIRGESIQLRLKGLLSAEGLQNGRLISAGVNGFALNLDSSTEIPGLGRFELSSDGLLRFSRGSNQPSELQFSGELIGNGERDLKARNYARTSVLLRPEELNRTSSAQSSLAAQTGLSNDGYTLSISSLNGSGERVSTTTVPLRFDASDRSEQVTAATFAPLRPRADGSDLRDFTGSGRFSDASLARQEARRSAQTNLRRQSALTEVTDNAGPTSLEDLYNQALGDPYELYKGQLNRFSITLVDLVNSFTNGATGQIPILSNITSKIGAEVSLSGLISYQTGRNEAGDQRLEATAGLNLRFGRTLPRTLQRLLKDPMLGGPGVDGGTAVLAGPNQPTQTRTARPGRGLITNPLEDFGNPSPSQSDNIFDRNNKANGKLLTSDKKKKTVKWVDDYQDKDRNARNNRSPDFEQIAYPDSKKIQKAREEEKQSGVSAAKKVIDDQFTTQAAALSLFEVKDKDGRVIARLAEPEFLDRNFVKTQANTLANSKFSRDYIEKVGVTAEQYAQSKLNNFPSVAADFLKRPVFKNPENANPANANTAAYLNANVGSGYLFNKAPWRAIDLLTAARETYSYSSLSSSDPKARIPQLAAKRIQFGIGVDLGVFASLSLGLPINKKTLEGSGSFRGLSLLDAQVEAGLRVALTAGIGLSKPRKNATLKSSLIWEKAAEGDYDRARPAFYYNLSQESQKAYNIFYYISVGSSTLAPLITNTSAIIKSIIPNLYEVSRTGTGGGGRLASGVQGIAQLLSEFPYLATAGSMIFENNFAFSKVDDVAVTLSGQAYANGSISVLNGLIGGYTRNSVGFSWLIPSSLGWNYSSEAGYTLGGISRSLWNVRDQQTLTGDASGFIANTYAQAAPSLSASLHAPPADTNGALAAPLATVPLRLSAQGGAINLAALGRVGPALNGPLANGDVVVSIEAVVQAPANGAIDADGNLRDLRLNLAGSPLAVRLLYDRRALLPPGPGRLGLEQPWQSLINQWADPGAPSSARIGGVKPGTFIPLQIDVRLPQGSDPAALTNLQLAYQLDGAAPLPFATAQAPLLDTMPDAPVQRGEAGSAYLLGPNASGSLGAPVGEPLAAPYISALVISAAGQDYRDGDFLIEEGDTILRGRLNTDLLSGAVTSAPLYDTGSAAAFSGEAYRRLDDSALQVRLRSGSDAQVRLTAANGNLSGSALALAADGKSVLAGSGYLAGGSGLFHQWVSGTATTPGQSARALLRVVVRDGSVSEVSILEQQGSFADNQPEAIALSNSIAAGGSGLSLVPLLRTRLDVNLLDDSSPTIGSVQRYRGTSFSAEADLVYTQGGPDRSQPINGSLNLDTPLAVNRFYPDGRGWVNIRFNDPTGVYTPGADGFNFDTSISSVFFGANDGKRSVVAWSHANLEEIQTQRDLYLLPDAILQAQIYTSLETKDTSNNPFFDTPQLLSDPDQKGSNSNALITPFAARLGNGVTPIYDNNNQLLAAWVHTSPDGQAEIQVRIGTAGIDPSNGRNTLRWGKLRAIPLARDVNGNDVTDLSLTYLDGRPVLSWSLKTRTPYQAQVLKENPTAYHRLNDLPSQGTLNSISSNTLATGEIVGPGNARRFSSWMDTPATPLSQNALTSSEGALVPAADSLVAPVITSEGQTRGPLEQLAARVQNLSQAHGQAFGSFLGRNAISEQQISTLNNNKSASAWVETLQQILDGFAADHEAKKTAIRQEIGKVFIDLYGERIQFRTIGFGGREEYDGWQEQGVLDDYELAIQTAYNERIGFDFTTSQRDSLRQQIATDLSNATSSVEDVSSEPGDPDLGLRFGAGAFGLLPSLTANRLGSLNDTTPQGYLADLWVKTSVADGPGSILDNGLWNPNAQLPSSQQLQLPVQLRRIASTEAIDGIETKGYRYALVVPAGSFAELGSDGLGGGLSPFNLAFAAEKGLLRFSGSGANLAAREIDFKGADLAEVVDYRTRGGRLSSFTLGEEDVVLSTFFEADASSPGTSKEAREVSYDNRRIGIETRQIAGWSLRKRVEGNQQFVDFNYGYDPVRNTAASLTARLPENSWSHVAISYGPDPALKTKVARLFIDGLQVAEAIEDPQNLKGHDFNLLPLQLGYRFNGSLDDLVLNDEVLGNPQEQLSGRYASRYVNPRSASEATFSSLGRPADKAGDSNDWIWDAASPFDKAEAIPSTIPGLIRSAPVDMATAGSLSELRGDGKADLAALLPLTEIAVGSRITGIRARLADGREYAIGDGFQYGMDGRSSTVTPRGLIGVVSNDTLANSGARGVGLDLAMMTSRTELNLFLPVEAALSGSAVQIVAFTRSPLSLTQGGPPDLWPRRDPARPGENRAHSTTLLESSSLAVLSPFYSRQEQVEATVQREANLSLLDINTGFVTSLAQTNEATLRDPNAQRYSETLAAGNLLRENQPTAFVAIGNPGLDGIAGRGDSRGVVWVLRHDVNAAASSTADRLQRLQSLVASPRPQLDAAGLEGLVIIGRDGQRIGGSLLWADLNGDRHDDLIIGSPSSRSGAGVAGSGTITVISGAFIASRVADGSREIDLATLDPTSMREFEGPAGSEFGTALAFGNVLAADRGAITSHALLIGAPGYVATASTDFQGNSIAPADRRSAALGAVFQLKASAAFFEADRGPRPELLITGDLPELPNFNIRPDQIDRRFGASLAVTSSLNNRDFSGDGIADIAIGLPGLILARKLKGGIQARATAEQRDAELAGRSTIPDVYREGIDPNQESDIKDVNTGGVLLLAGGAANEAQATLASKVLLRGDTLFGEAAAAGTAIASGGDFNGGSVDDLAIGSPEVDNKSGVVSLVSGSDIRNWFTQASATNYASLQRSALIDARLIIQNDQPNGLLGRSLALNGDLNRDGKADLVIGDAAYASGTGRVSVLFGASNDGGAVKGQTIARSALGNTTYHRLDVSNADTRLDIYPGSFGEGLGGSVLLAANAAPRPNGSITADLLLPTANGSSTLLTLYGKPRLRGLGSFSSRDLGSSAGIEISDVLPRSGTPASYGLVGDVNGDGNADALVDLNPSPDLPRFKLSFGTGAGFSPEHAQAGTGGSSVLDLSTMLAILNPGASDFVLRDVLGIGDLNNDAVDDLLIHYRFKRDGRLQDDSALLLGGELLTSNVLLQESAVLRPLQAPEAFRAAAPIRARDAITPIGSSETALNGGDTTLIGVAGSPEGDQLRVVLPVISSLNVAALLDGWLAGLPVTTAAEREQLNTINRAIQQDLLQPFDPAALDAAEVSIDNLLSIAAVLDSLAPGAGASFRNDVEGRSPLYRQQAIRLIPLFGDSPDQARFADDTLPTQAGDVLLAGQRLKAGSYLRSANGRFAAVMQEDGNLVVFTLRSDGTTPEVSFSLNDLVDSNGNPVVANVDDASVRLGRTPGTSLEIRNGKLTFVNENFRSSDGSNGVAVEQGFYNRFGRQRAVGVTPLAAGARFEQLRLTDEGVLVGSASDGRTLFSFEPSYSSNIISGPIPAERLANLTPLLGYEALDLRGRNLHLVDRNGDGNKELLITPGPGASDRALYSVALTGEAAQTGPQWLVTPIATTQLASGSFLWSSSGDKPANQMPADQAGDVQIRTINGYTRFQDRDQNESPDKPVETGGDIGINGASLSRPMLYLGGVHANNSYGQYSRKIGGADLKQRLQQQGESWELKSPLYVSQMKSKGDGRPAGEGGDEVVLHLGSGQGIRARVGDTSSSSVGLDGLTISVNEWNQSLRLFWNGQLLWQAGRGASDADLARLLSSEGNRLSMAELKNFMAPDGGLHNGSTGDGRELMSIFGQWLANLFSTGFYLRYQSGAFSEAGVNYQGRLILEVAKGMRYLPFPGGSAKLNVINKGLQLSIPIKDTIRFDGADVTLNAYGWSGGAKGVNALGGLEFNTDRIQEGAALDRLMPVGDLNGDGYEELVGLGSLPSGWNYDYKLDLPNSNLKERGTSSDSTDENRFTLQKGANGEGISRSNLISPVIVWGSASGDINLDAMTPIVRGSRQRYRPSGAPGGDGDPGLATVDNFTAAANVDYVPLGDFNADGFDDLAITDYGTGGSTWILYGGTGLRDARSYLERFGAFFSETRSKDSSSLPFRQQEAPDVYLKSNPRGFGIQDDDYAAWIRAINLERFASSSDRRDPAFGAVRVSRISGIPGQRLADLSGGADFSGDGLNDLFLTSQTNQEAPSRYVLFGSDLTGSITLLGTADSDSLEGTPTNDVIVSLAGNDIAQGKGGMDAISTGPGDDRIYIDDDQFRRIDGGSDFDSVILQGVRDQAWDFTKLAARLRRIENLDLTGHGANRIRLNAAAVRAMSSDGTLSIEGDFQADTPLQKLAGALAERLNPLDPSSRQFEALAEFAGRISAFNFSSGDLSILPLLLEDVQRDLITDQLRALRGDTGPRPLADLRARLTAIDAATPLLPGETAPPSGAPVLGLAAGFMNAFSQSLNFTARSLLESYEAWLQTLPALAPALHARLSTQQKAALAALPASWRSAYPAYFNSGGIAPSDRAFELRLNDSPTGSSIAEAYRQWLSDPAVRSTYNLPASTDSRQSALLSVLADLEATGPALISEVLSAVDHLQLSSEFSLVASDVPNGNTSVNEYSADNGNVRLLVPDWIAVVMDPSVPTVLTPTPPTVSSADTPPTPGSRLEAAPQADGEAPVLSAAPANRDDLRVSVGESRPGPDGRSLVIPLFRSGYLEETTRVLANTTGYVKDLVPSVLAQVVFAPGDTRQELIIPLMQALPGEQAAINPYDQTLSSEVSVRLDLLPAGSRGPRSTTTLALNALNAFTPELEEPSRPLDPSLLETEALFERDIALLLPQSLWITALAEADQPIRFGLDSRQGPPPNELLLLDRTSGSLSSLFGAAAAGEALIYGDTYLSPSTDLYFSVDDGGRFDQDGQANGQITLAATAARTSPGTLLLGDQVLRAPSSSGLNLLFSSRSGGLQRPALQGYSELLFLPTDDTRAGLRQTDGSILTPADGPAYLAALSQRLESSSPFAAAVARVSLAGGTAGLLDPLGNAQALKLSNDTNYIPVLSRAGAGSTPTAADLALPSLTPLSEGTRATATYDLNLGGQGLIVSFSSPYRIVPGVAGSPVPFAVQFRPPSGSPASSWQVALLRVDDPGSDAAALLAGDDLADRLTPIPAADTINLLAGDLILPLLFRGIDPAAWAALPAGQRTLADANGTWSVEIADPGLDPSPLLRRISASSYRVGSDGVLVLNLGDAAEDNLGGGPRVLTDGQANRLERDADADGLTFLNNVIFTGAGDDVFSPPAAEGDGDNILFSGAGRDAVTPLPGDVVYSGSDADRIESPLDRAAAGARIDAGRGRDQIGLRGGGVRWIGGAGSDAFLPVGGRDAISIVSGGQGGDHFGLLPADGSLPAAPLVIVDFSPEQGDRLVVPGYASSDLNFQELPQGVQIGLGNTPLALLLNRTIEQVNVPEWFLERDSLIADSSADTRLVQSRPLEPADQQPSGDGVLSIDELINDGVNGLAAHARRALGVENPELRVYIHNAIGPVSISGGRLGAQTLDAIALNEEQLQWMRQQLASLAGVLDLELRFVDDRRQSNLDIYYSDSVDFSEGGTLLGITLNNDNGRQVWTEMVLNGSQLSSNPEGFRYTFLHEMLHVFGGEHPFDNSDGDSEGQAFGAPDGDITLLSYTRPAAGWPDSYRWLDWAALVSLWGLNDANGSGWRFRSASGEESVLNSEQAIQRLSQPQDGASFLGRADGLVTLPELPANPTPPGEVTSETGAETGVDGEPAPEPNGDAGLSETGDSNSGSGPDPAGNGGSDGSGEDIPEPLVKGDPRIRDGGEPDGPTVTTTELPSLIEPVPPGDQQGGFRLSWQSDWKQLDLELGAILTSDDQLRLLTPADLGVDPSGSLMLPGLSVLGSRQSDVVFAAAANRIDLDAGADSLFSLAAGGGANRLFGGDQADSFYLAAAADRVFGGSSIAGSDEGRSDGARNSFLIDLDSRPDSWRDPDATILIGDFQVGLDALSLSDPDPSRSQPLPITAASYLSWKERLASEQNISLNAAPRRRFGRRGLLLDATDLQQGLSLNASTFFADPDDLGSPPASLRFVDVDASLPWLQLRDGQLHIAAGTVLPAGVNSIKVAASDGLSRTQLATIQLAFAPTVTIGSLEIPAGSALRFAFAGIGQQARELLVQTLDANGNPSGELRSIAAQVGLASGTPDGFASLETIALAADAFSAGSLAFFLRPLDGSQSAQRLTIRDEGPGGFRLEGSDLSIQVTLLEGEPPAPAISSLELESGEPMLGLALPGALEPTTAGRRSFELRGTLFREAAFNSVVGFYLADRGTGSIIDALTGAFLTDSPVDDDGTPSPDYLSTAVAHAIWQGTVADGEQATISARFQLDGHLDPSQLILLPFLQVADPNGPQTYSSGLFGNPDERRHVVQLGERQLGFEDLLGGGDADHDDLIFRLDSLSQI